jgi:uncharacterized protein YbaR (Trm112 family)
MHLTENMKSDKLVCKLNKSLYGIKQDLGRLLIAVHRSVKSYNIC